LNDFHQFIEMMTYAQMPDAIFSDKQENDIFSLAETSAREGNVKLATMKTLKTDMGCLKPTVDDKWWIKGHLRQV
jgi:hypothetical protein